MVKNITLSADFYLIKKAREKAKTENKSLNTVFREWLMRYTGKANAKQRYKKLMHDLRDIDSKRHYSREELNER